MPKGIFGFRGKPSVCHPNKPNYAKGRCKSCCGKAYYSSVEKSRRRPKLLKRLYGLSVEEFDYLLACQWGGCAICGSKKPDARTSHLVVDHNHQTGAVRGILCQTCNRGIGYLKDDPKLVSRALEYLESEPVDLGLIRDIKK